MAKVVILIDDTTDGEVEVKFTCDTPIPEDYSKITVAQLLASQLAAAIEKLFEEQAPDV